MNFFSQETLSCAATLARSGSILAIACISSESQSQRRIRAEQAGFEVKGRSTLDMGSNERAGIGNRQCGWLSTRAVVLTDSDMLDVWGSHVIAVRPLGHSIARIPSESKDYSNAYWSGFVKPSSRASLCTGNTLRVGDNSLALRPTIPAL